MREADLQKRWGYESADSHARGKGTFEKRDPSAGAAAAEGTLSKATELQEDATGRLGRRRAAREREA